MPPTFPFTQYLLMPSAIYTALLFSSPSYTQCYNVLQFLLFSLLYSELCGEKNRLEESIDIASVVIPFQTNARCCGSCLSLLALHAQKLRKKRERADLPVMMSILSSIFIETVGALVMPWKHMVSRATMKGKRGRK